MHMQRKKIVWISVLIALLLATAITTYFVYLHYQLQPTKGTIEELSSDQQTHGMVFFEPEVDELMLGKWQHTTDTSWYRVYTTEPADEDFCWGREWNEAEDIYEEDLMPYGNGWFKWKKTDNDVIEWHATDNHSAFIPYEYKVLQLNETELYFKEVRDAQKQRFRKCD